MCTMMLHCAMTSGLNLQSAARGCGTGMCVMNDRQLGHIDAVEREQIANRVLECGPAGLDVRDPRCAG